MLLSTIAVAQSWSTFLDPSRAIDWSSAGFAIPAYTASCATQPTLKANDSSAAAANATAIQTALGSCDATHNVVNVPTGTYYVAGFNYGPQGHQVLRGAGPNSTYLYITSSPGVNMQAGWSTWGNDDSVKPPSGSNQCSWSAGYNKGATTITLSNCGGSPPVNQQLVIDQANDMSDTGGIFVCDDGLDGCTLEPGPGDIEGRLIDGVTHAQQQIVYTKAVTSLGGGSYSVTISPGVYYNNVRAGQSPGAWWPGTVQNDGIENLTLDYSYSDVGSTGYGAVTMYSCYQCWMKNIRSIDGTRDHVHVYQSSQDVIRDSYFYQAHGHASESYCVELDETSGILVENNIFQQQTVPVLSQNSSGSVVAYNFGIDDLFAAAGYLAGAYYNHNAGNEMDLWEGNNFAGIWGDAIHGSSPSGTLFRNVLSGWQAGDTLTTIPIILRSFDRAFNVIGNVLGQPGYHNQYQAYATSQTAGTGGDAESTSIYSLGWATDNWCGTGGSASPFCDPKVFSTLMRWGNWDVVTNGAKWDSNEASPAAVPYVSANFTSAYFGSLPHTLPASLYYNSKPPWWPAGKAWPPVGPDVSGGNLGTCTGTYAGVQATSATQCTGGTLSSQWAAHVSSIPAQDCYLNVMHGPPDGTGGVLPFDASQCYTTSATTGGTVPAPPTSLAAIVS
jgi:hypothetical protein